jgi:uncharacterized protein (DUF1800 family)
MTTDTLAENHTITVQTDAPASTTSTLQSLAAVGLTAALAACGGGGGSDGGSASGSSTETTNATAAAATAATAAAAVPTAAEASRFLAQASMGATRAEIASVQSLGYAGWLDAQFALPASGTRWDRLVSRGYNVAGYRTNQAGFDDVTWSKVLGSPDTLRQRITLALSEIFVIGIDGLVGRWPQFGAAGYLDLIEANAFGNYRKWLEQMALSPAMGEYLTYRGSAKMNTTSGALPDENFAREIMQLFTIGLVMLNADGSTALTNGAATPTYQLADITGLARVFTGWDFDTSGLAGPTPTDYSDYIRRPMVQVASRYETGAKTFLGYTIPAGTSATDGLTMALDKIFAHQNVAPFFCKQLIQRLVTSNPSPAYVARISAVFLNDGSGVKGNLRAVIRALLLDSEARTAPTSSTFGKLREPILRVAGWARAYQVTSPNGAWAYGDTSDAGTSLGQSPLRSPSVFNFFRPGYVPPETALYTAALAAPEFQITNESSVVGYINFMQRTVSSAIGDLTPDYSSLTAIADDATALVSEINLVLAANQLSAATVSTLAAAIATMGYGTAWTRLLRAKAALVLVLAAPEYLIQK